MIIKKSKNPKTILKMIYLYILSFVGIIITVVATIGLVNLVLRQYVFQVDMNSYYYPAEICSNPKTPTDKTPTKEEIAQCEKDQEQRNKEMAMSDTKRELANEIAGILIGLPLWLYHWGIIRKEKEI
jgi:N-acyl-D-aspartate/D-glutamate deacylase